MKIPIVVVAYNRPRSLKRLLKSIADARYPNGDIELIISIDRGDDNQKVLELANQFDWKFGTKKVIYQESNLGLRKHILKCGGLSLEYGAVIVLEDDLFVSPNFYLFTEQALRFSSSDSFIGGISLYNHQLNVHSRDNFSALEDGYDNWYFQFASSWGQAWTKEQWSGFAKWYDQNPDIGSNPDIPAYVRSWSSKSWLKYNIAYLIENNRYFLYPKISLTTNFSDAGTHVGNDSTIYQVPLDYGPDREYKFSRIKEASAIYDAYYESTVLHKVLNIDETELSTDLFGYKPHGAKRYVLTSKVLDFEIVKSFGKSLKPHEDNIFRDIGGTELFLYDTMVPTKNPNKLVFERKVIYNFKQIPFKTVKKLYWTMSKARYGRVLKKLFKR
ncbi:glycosyltransferase [Flagellimonas sp. 2504JD4-2]